MPGGDAIPLCAMCGWLFECGMDVVRGRWSDDRRLSEVVARSKDCRGESEMGMLWWFAFPLLGDMVDGEGNDGSACAAIMSMPC